MLDNVPDTNLPPIPGEEDTTQNIVNNSALPSNDIFLDGGDSTSTSNITSLEQVYGLPELSQKLVTPLPVPMAEDEREFVSNMSKLYGTSMAKIVRDSIRFCMTVGA